MFIQRKKNITASEELMDDVVDNGATDVDLDSDADVDGAGEVTIDPEATDLLFEAEDVAELIAEVTGESVEVTVEDNSVEFAIGEDVFTVEAEGDEEILEAASKKVLKGKRTVSASTQRRATSAVAGKRNDKVVRKVPTRGRR